MIWRWLGLALVFVPTSLSGQWHEWRDDRGVVHVTNEPAPGRTPRAEPPTSAPPDRGAAVAAAVSLTTRSEAADPAAAELRRHEERLAEREAYLQLLRAAGVDSAARREMENLVVDEARQERAAIDALRAGTGPDAEGRSDRGQ